MPQVPFDPVAAARFIADAHARREAYSNLAGSLEPRNVNDAYAVQEALRAIWQPTRGRIAGLKIATTTKVMQQLMGIDHPCGGMIYERCVHTSPYRLRLADHIHVVVECELAVRVNRTLAKKSAPWTPSEVRAAVGEVMPAFELIEDRNAVYKQCKAYSLIADNSWNAGIVLGKPVAVSPDKELNGLSARLNTGSDIKVGKTDDPMGALAWVANLAADRSRPLEAGQVVITGSVVATLPIAAGETFRFSIDGLGDIEMSATA